MNNEIDTPNIPKIKEILEKDAEEEKKQIEMLKDKHLLLKIIEEAHNDGVVGEENTLLVLINKINLRLVKNAHPTSSNTIVSDITGAGKDFITKKICNILVPEDKYEHRTDLSETVWKYWHANEPDFSFDGHVIHLEDPKDGLLKSQPFKTMASGGNRSTITINNEAIDLIINGKPVIIVTSYKATIDDEGMRRWDNLRTDTTEIQTELIKKKALEEAAGIRIEGENDLLRNALQRRLEPHEVVIPFAKELVDSFPNTVLMRTQIHKLLDYIKSSAVLHQYNREKDNQGRLIANWFDYDYARFVFIQLRNEEGKVLSKEEEEFINVLRTAGRALSIREITTLYDKHGKTWIYEHIEPFKEKELIVETLEYDHLSNKDISKLSVKNIPDCSAMSHSTWFNVSSPDIEKDHQQEGFPVILDFAQVLTGLDDMRKIVGLPIFFIDLKKNQKNQENIDSYM